MFLLKKLFVAASAAVVSFALFASTSDYAKYVDFTVSSDAIQSEGAAVVPVRLSAGSPTGFDYADFQTADGSDILVTDPTGETVYPCEVDTWDPNGESLLWVRLPNAQQGAAFRLWYGNSAGADDNVPSATWADYTGVWHLGTLTPDTSVANAQGTYANSTAATGIDGHLSTYGVPNETGVLGKCFRVNDSTGKQQGNYKLGGVWVNDAGTDSPIDGGTQFTISGWFKHKDCQFYYDKMFFKRERAGNQCGGNAFAAEIETANATAGVAAFGAGSKYTIKNFETFNNTWRYVTLVFDGSACSVYQNGTLVGSPAINPSVDNDLPLVFGNNIKVADGAGDAAWNGWIDEVRFSKGAKSADFIAAEYAAMATTDLLTAGEVQDNAFVPDVLTVKCSLGEVGTVEPAYGKYGDIGASLTFTAPAEDQALDETTRYRFVGWERTVERSDRTKTVTSGEGTSVTLAHEAGTRETFRWKAVWVYRVDAATASPAAGTVTGSGWYAADEVASLAATPNAGFAFSKWTGEGAAQLLPEQVTSASIDVAVKGPIALTAVFGGNYYVAAEGGSNDNDGLTEQTAFADVWHAVEVAGDGSTITLLDGTHYFPSSTTPTLQVDKPIRITSKNGPAATILRGHYVNGAKTSQRGLRILNLDCADAIVENLTLADATMGTDPDYSSYSSMGCCALILNGTLRGCTVRGGNVFGYSGGIHLVNGLVSRCIITGNSATAGHSTGCGIGMVGGTLEHSLIYGNTSAQAKTGTGVYVNGASCIVRNCTVARNSTLGAYGAGLQANNAKAKIIDCIAWDNTSSRGVENFSGSADVTNLFDEGDPLFTDPDNGDFTLKDGSVCIDAAVGEPTVTLDLAGNPRATRIRMDIGCYEAPAFAGDTLEVTGDYDNLGTVEPAYGDYEDVGASLTFTAPAEDQETDDEKKRYRFLGWERTVVHPDGSSVKTSGEGTSVTVPHAAGDKEFFHWKISYVYKVDATVADEHAGSTTGTDWYLDGSNAVVSATANEHYAFSAWTGDGVKYLTDEQKTSAQIEIAVTAPVALTATFSATYYVAAEGGSNDNDGLTELTAFADVWHAVSVAGDGSAIILLDGKHHFPDAATKGLVVDKAITIRSVNGPEATTIAASYWDGEKFVANSWRIVYLANARAKVEGVTLKGGNQLSGDEVKSSTGGGVVLMEGGTLTNCVVTGGKVFGAAGGIYMNGGLVTGCVISNNSATAGHSNGGGIYMAGAATLEHSLVAGNSCTANGNGPYGGGIYVKDAKCTVRNCTIVRNSCRYGAGIYISSANAVVTDTISYGNTPTTTEDATPDFVGTCNATNVCSSVQKGVVMVNGELAPDQTMLTGDPGFADFAKGDYTLKSGSRCLDIAFGEPTVALDLAGKNRVSNEIMDLGCYELQQEGLRDVIITWEKTSQELGSNTVVCTATGVGMTPDPAACYWTFDGRAPSAGDYDAVGDWTDVKLPPGTYTVRFSTVYGGTEYTKSSEPGALVIAAKTVFLKPENPNAKAPYDTWDIAATNLSDAIAIAGDGTTLLYAPGTYHLYAGVDVPVACTNVATDGDPANTTLQAHSCGVLRITADALFDGFTLKGGSGFGDNGGCLYLQRGTVRNSIVTGGKATNGAGVYMSGGLLSRCVVSNNTHAQGHCRGAGIYATGGTVEHSLVVNNQNTGVGGYGANAQGGGIYATSATIRNCTVVGNMTRYGAGIYGNGSTKVENTISYGNIQASTGDSSDGVPNWYGLSAANAVNFCTTSVSGQFGTALEPDGTPSEDQAKFIGNPGFVNLEAGDWTLALGSRCLDAAFGEPTVALDVAGNPRVSNGIMDLGCFELQQESIKGLSITVTPAGTVGTNNVDFAAMGHGIDLGAGAVYWTFDGREPTAEDHDATGEAFTRTLPPGVYKVNAKAVIGGEEYAITDVTPFTLYSLKIFILPENPNARYPYDTWEIAATNVESAFELATAGSVVTFGDGTHRIYKDRAITVPMTIRSANGAARTVLDGGRRDVFAANVSAFFLLSHREATVEGLTLANGGNSKDLGISPLGITAGRLVDCVVTNCYNYELNGTVRLSSSDTSDGYAAVISNCVIVGNKMRVKDVKGVGVYASGAGCLVVNCEIRDNVAGEYQYSANHGALALIGGATAINCLVAGNTACATAGLYVEGAKAYNCTVVSNTSIMATSTPSSGGIWANASSEVVNCLSWGNVSATITDPTDVDLNAGGSDDAYRNCALPVVRGAKCVLATDPRFRNAAKGNYDIRGKSPCTNAAEPMDWMTGATDLKGRPRTLGEGPDIGCYESTGVYGLGILVR